MGRLQNLLWKSEFTLGHTSDFLYSLIEIESLKVATYPSIKWIKIVNFNGTLSFYFLNISWHLPSKEKRGQGFYISICINLVINVYKKNVDLVIFFYNKEGQDLYFLFFLSLSTKSIHMKSKGILITFN